MCIRDRDPNVPIDTNMGTQAYLIMVSDQACETLIGLNNDTTLDPQLLKQMPTVSDDGLTYSFELKDGVKDVYKRQAQHCPI